MAVSNHLVISCEMFYDMGKLCTAIHTHGYQPKDILLGTISSTPKDRKGNVCSGTNYRGVALCSSISKLVDIVMIIRYSGRLNTSEIQFAFKKNHSTVMCSLVFKEVVNYEQQVRCLYMFHRCHQGF